MVLKGILNVEISISAVALGSYSHFVADNLGYILEGHPSRKALVVPS
jgi:hypothetical protein